jgi:hypothetical protein
MRFLLYVSYCTVKYVVQYLMPLDKTILYCIYQLYHMLSQSSSTIGVKSPKSLRPKKARQVHASVKTMLISFFFFMLMG